VVSGIAALKFMVGNYLSDQPNKARRPSCLKTSKVEGWFDLAFFGQRLAFFEKPHIADLSLA
jgi:hypothetical protein